MTPNVSLMEHFSRLSVDFYFYFNFHFVFFMFRIILLLFEIILKIFGCGFGKLISLVEK